MHNLYTTGYQGQTINQFLIKLLNNKINTLIDIRENPVSRKPGFSKGVLKNSVNHIGIKYLHFNELGTPKPLRTFLYETNDYKQFFKLYKNYISEYSDSIYDLVDISKQENICILCFEKDHKTCHRNVIAELIEENFGKHVSIVHI